MFEWDEAKRQANLAKHGVDFAEIEGFDWTTADPFYDRRHAYGEERESALGMIGGRLHFLVFTRRGTNTRIISLRKANKRERSRWNTSAE